MKRRGFAHLASAVSGIAMLGAAALSTPAVAAPPDNSHNPALPQFNVTGTDYMLHNSVRAEEAARNVRKARDAIARCDRLAFDSARNAIFHEGRYARDAPGGGYVEGLFGANSARDDADPLEKIGWDLYAEWIRRCGPRKASEAARSSFTAGGGIHAGRVNLPTLRYLGFENAITLDQTIGVVDGEDEADVSGVSAVGSFYSGAIDLDVGGFWEIALASSSADVSSKFTNIDPAGDGLLIPGPQGGASGFALPSAGGLNVVSQADFSARYDWTSVHGKLVMPINRETLLILPFVGFGYTRTEFDARFEGSIPGFARDFAYATDVEVDAISPMAGMEVVRDFGGYSLRAGGLFAVDFNDAEGCDRLSFTGFPDSEAPLKNDDTTVSGRAWAGVTFGAAESPFKVSFDLGWIRAGNAPDITRDGANPSRLDLEAAEAYFAMMSARYSL